MSYDANKRRQVEMPKKLHVLWHSSVDSEVCSFHAAWHVSGLGDLIGACPKSTHC